MFGKALNLAALHCRSDDNLSATENAVASLGRILEFQPDVIDSQQGKVLGTTWVQSLPIVEDTIEAVKVHAQLVKFLEKSDPRYGLVMIQFPPCTFSLPHQKSSMQ